MDTVSFSTASIYHVSALQLPQSRRKSAGSPARSARPTLLGRAMTGAFRRLSPVRRASTDKIDSPPISSDLDEQPEPPDIKGPLGLTLLRDDAHAQVDFIFVHGLGGGSRKTWSFSSDPGHYWPKDWLSRDPEFRHVRIHSFGYKADWDEWKESVLNIHDFARSLLNQVHCDPEIRRSKTKIVFVAHSMGGIVTKKAYILAREDPDLKEVADRIHTLYFLATPHRGSDLAETLVKILRMSYGPKPFVTELVRNSESIASTNDSFRHFAEDVQLWSFYETLPTNLGLMKALIVDKASATLGYAREQSSPMNADHRGICKFDRQTDPNYRILRNAFVTTIDEISSQSSLTATKISKEQHQQLVDLTRVTEAPVDDLAALNELRVAHSCEWISSKNCYSSWLSSEAISPRPILWVTGNAGFGKSVLSSYIISDIQQRNRKCCYFFFKHGNSTTSSISGCLRSLAYQIAVSDAQILKSLIEIQKEASSQEQWDEKTIWRKLFIGSIFKQSNPQPCLWVLDGLDECRRFPALISLLTQIPSWLRILITSRTTSEMSKSLTILSETAEIYEIKESDTLNDINSYIDSKIDSLPAGDAEGQNILKEKILKKASGSFLWVSLVIRDLENAFSEEDAEEILNEVPTDMNEFYARMVDTLLQNPRAAILAKALFMWTLMAFRPLQISELQIILKLDTNQTIPNLSKVLPAICGQLISVNQKMEAEVIHQTARAYLLQQQDYPELELEKGECHTRMTELCLKFLTGNSFKEGRTPTKSANSAQRQSGDFAAYACDYFSNHLQRCSSEDTIIWELLCRFLKNDVLSWIESLARTRRLAVITKTAKNLQAYLRRRVKYLSPLSSEKEEMETWISDLIRLNARFGSCLSISPSAITSLIPSMCPSDSIIHQTYASKQRGLVVKGLSDKTWDDCLARIDYPGRHTSAVACGEQFSAVAIADGTIFLYHQDSVQLKSTLNNKTRATILAFSNEDRYLASNAFRSVKVWDPAEGTQVWSFDMSHQALTLLFVGDNSTIATATQGNYILAWDLSDGQQVRKWQWNLCVDESPIHKKPTQAPGKALFSPEYQTLAVTYRGLPIYLFDLQTERLIGCCSRGARILPRGASNHYVVDALAFNPSSEIDVLVSSYGDGELSVFDLRTAQLRHSIPEVYAHSIACSPGGRTIVTGSPRGTIQIFEFGGASGERLVNLYRIDAHDDCVKAIAFSSDSLRFADIRGTQYRIWEPAVLVCNDLGEGSHSEFSQAIPVAPKSVSMMEGPLEAEITTMCWSSDNVVFCGKQDGSVIYFDTRTANQMGVIYRHAARIRITSIVYLEKTASLATADESGRILVNQLSSWKNEITQEKIMAEIRLEESITSLLSDPSGTRILARGETNTEVWTTEGEKVGFSIAHNDEASFVNHPLSPGHFLIIEYRSIRIFSWADSMEANAHSNRLDRVQLTLTPPSPTISRTSSPKNAFDFNAEPASPPFIAKFSAEKSISKICCDFPVLNIWSASSVVNSNIYPIPIQLPGFNTLTNKIRQIIAVAGSAIFFLDTNLWVCSVDLALVTPKSHEAKRHFFLLSEWQTVDGGFIIDYISTNKEFVIARKHELLVISRGLEFAEPWFST